MSTRLQRSVLCFFIGLSMAVTVGARAETISIPLKEAPIAVPEITPPPAASPSVLTPVGNGNPSISIDDKNNETPVLSPAIPGQAAPSIIPSTMPPSELPLSQIPPTTPPGVAAMPPATDANGAQDGTPPATNPDGTPAAPAAPVKKEPEVKPPSEEEKKEASMLGYQPSYGSWPFSIMFSPREVSDLKKVLDYYEIQKYQAAKSVEKQHDESTEQVEDILQNAKIEKKALVYPIFQLRSIVYRAADNWTVTVNRKRYTSWDTPEKRDAEELKILALTPETVNFMWVPADQQFYVDMLQKQLMQGNGMAETMNPAGTPATPGAPDATPGTAPAAAPAPAGATPAFAPVSYANRIANNAPKPELDDIKRAVTFRLRPNQTVNLATFEVFEGRPATLVIPEDAAAQAAAAAKKESQLPAALVQQLDATKPAEGAPDAAAAPAEQAPKPGTSPTSPIPAGITPGTGAATPISEEDINGLLTGKSSPKNLIQKALQQSGKQ